MLLPLLLLLQCLPVILPNFVHIFPLAHCNAPGPEGEINKLITSGKVTVVAGRISEFHIDIHVYVAWFW